jgi:hypothetical protein
MNNSLQTDSDMMDLGEAIEAGVDLEKPEQGVELHIGSNVFRTTNGVIKLQGKEQIVLEVRPDPPALLLTMDFYDERGQRLGHLRRNTLSATGAIRFAVSMNTVPDATLDDPYTVTVSDRTTGTQMIELYLFQRRKVRVTSGHFYTHQGELVSISPHYCRIGTGLTMFGDVVESRGGTAVIG